MGTRPAPRCLINDNDPDHHDERERDQPMLQRRAPMGYTPQLMHHVGTGDAGPAGMMVAAGGGNTWGLPLARGFSQIPWGGGGGGCGVPTGQFAPPGGCAPCPPDSQMAAYQQAAYEMACREDAQLFYQAAKIDAKSRLPTKGMAGNSPIVTVGGVTSRNVAAFTAVTFPVGPSVVACITDWTISRVSTEFFEVQRLESGMTTYIGSDGPMPADSFAPDSTHPVMDFPTLWPGAPMSLTVANVTAEPHEFRSTFHFIRMSDPGSCLR
jgi:hypothetical protein